MINLIGIDPSTNHIGICILTLTSDEFIVKNIETIVLDVSKTNSVCDINNNLLYRLQLLTPKITKIMTKYSPVLVAMESPYIDRFRPASAIPLGQAVQAIEYGIISYNDNIPIGKYPPSTVKNIVGAKGGVDKIGILEAMRSVDEITNLCDIECITDHEVDAIAIAFCGLKDLKINPLLIY